ncbi:hypothetical protein [Burkholderia cepacia]|uniref:hypothetical protein n=1 Tax=Burkholderia cepacia TaxID=292 RepID=UPI0026E10C5B|nr:hypothetical protein [Burkholderia cepacia]MDO5947187.1 hypothetical protein [Burkholderia cepacia]
MNKFAIASFIAALLMSPAFAADVGGVVDRTAYDAALDQNQHVAVPIVKRLVKEEVVKREHAKVERVDIVSPGIARAVFAGGIATVRFGFKSPMDCPVSDNRQCEKKFEANPFGFEVLSYKSHRD